MRLAIVVISLLIVGATATRRLPDTVLIMTVNSREVRDVRDICDDGDNCTTDVYVDATTCLHLPKNCNDNNLCTTDGCPGTAGICRHSGRVCHLWSGPPYSECFPGDGLCYNYTTLYTHDYTSPACDDNDTDTADYYNNVTGRCYHVAASCDDGDPCTFDAYVVGTGCTHTPLVSPTAPEENVTDCEVPTCDAATGEIVWGPRDCSDLDRCTTDYCLEGTGCLHRPVATRVLPAQECVIFNCTNAATGAYDWAPVPDGTPCYAGDACERFACVGGLCRIRVGRSGRCFMNALSNHSTVVSFVTVVVVALALMIAVGVVMWLSTDVLKKPKKED